MNPRDRTCRDRSGTTLAECPDGRLTTHRHTTGLAACITRGRIVFVFGADGTDRIDLEPGDYVWIREGVMHDEETHDEAVEMIVASLEPFDTLED